MQILPYYKNIINFWNEKGIFRHTFLETPMGKIESTAILTTDMIFSWQHQEDEPIPLITEA